MERVKISGREKFKGSTWDGSNLSFERDRSFGFSWPQRNYSCNFCKKEFKSAQALGGHMNVHRRDRAKQLIQHSSSSNSSSTWENSHSFNPNPNPNYNPKTYKLPPQFLPKQTPARFLPYVNTYNYASDSREDLARVSPQIREIRMKLGMMEANSNNCVCEVGNEFKNFKKQQQENNGIRVCKKKEFLGLDLNMGLHQIRDSKEDLDLELRLGSF